MIETDQITEHLKTTERHHALGLWEAMCRRADTDTEYKAVFEDWLENGGTVKLRDDLCLDFKGDESLYRDHPVHRYPWNDAWMAIDSSRHEIAWEKNNAPTGP